jgi:hypothetical protein
MLTLSATVAALVLSPSAYAVTPKDPLASVSLTVERTVGAVTAVTGEVTTAVGSAAPPAQPLTTAVQETTTGLTRQVTTAVEEVAPAATGVAGNAAEAARPVASDAAGEAQAAPPPAAPPATPPAPGLEDDPSRAARRDAAVSVPADRVARQPVDRRPSPKRSVPLDHPGPPAGPAQAPAAQPLSPGERPHAGERVLETGSSAPPADEAPALAGGSASAPSAGLALGGLALLAIALCLAAPGGLRSLLTLPAHMRPALFVSALERPG